MINRDVVKNFLDDNFPGYNQHGSEINFNSPFFNDTKKRLYVNIDTGKWIDFHEGKSGSFPSFVSEYLGVNLQEANRILESDYTSVIPNTIDIRDILLGIQSSGAAVEESVTVKDPLSVKPTMFDEVDELDEDGEEAFRYLNSRKISTNGLGYFSKSDKEYGGRIFIPFYEDGKLVYFLARSYTGSDLRYKNPVGLDTGVVFNYDKIEDSVAIFEGAFDAMSLDNMVGTAILSNKMKEGQAKKLIGIESLNTVVFVPDHDENRDTRRTILKNMIANYRLLNKFKKPSRNIDFYVYDLPDGYKDFGEYKQKTGNGNINLADCSRFNENTIAMKLMLL